MNDKDFNLLNFDIVLRHHQDFILAKMLVLIAYGVQYDIEVIARVEWLKSSKCWWLSTAEDYVVAEARYQGMSPLHHIRFEIDNHDYPSRGIQTIMVPSSMLGVS